MAVCGDVVRREGLSATAELLVNDTVQLCYCILCSGIFAVGLFLIDQGLLILQQMFVVTSTRKSKSVAFCIPVAAKQFTKNLYL